jgi:hypothetical protein
MKRILKMSSVSSIIIKELDTHHVTECLSKDWKSPIYAFYEPIPMITYVNDHHCHEFMCAACGCKYKARQYLDMKDKASTGNLIKHAWSCWGEEAWTAASECKDVNEAREYVTKPMARTGSITATFKRLGKGKVTYSHCMHTKTETKYVFTACLDHHLNYP